MANVLANGCGALAIDASRIAPVAGEHVGPGSYSDPSKRSGEVGSDMGFTKKDVAAFQQAQAASVERANRLGRFPNNMLLTIESATDIETQGGGSRFFQILRSNHS